MKIYTEKATQTDSFAVLATPPVALGSSEQEFAPLKLVNKFASGTVFTLQDGAYTYSETQMSDTSTGKSPLRSSIPTRQRYPQLPFNRPVEFRSSAKRVVSLPDEYTDKQRPEEPSQRVVSMPERLKSSSPSASDSFSSLDTSIESNAYMFTKPSRLHMFPSSDLPSTPSPPSSPESIMIIGNDSQVPRTLLRPGYAYNQRYGDTSGKFCLLHFS